MKKVILSCILICSALFFATAEKSENFNWGYSISAGIHSGKTQEFVNASTYTMSRLDWQTYCSPVVQLAGNVNIFHAIIDADFYTVIPLKCGEMEDWDWIGSDHSKATNYSISDLTINKDYQFNVKTGYEFLFKGFRILPEIGFEYRNRKYEANGGYYQYGSMDNSNGGYWSSSLKKYDLYGTVMTYEQQLFMPYVYLDAEYTFCKNWTAKLFGSYIPYIKCDAIDFHCATSTKLYQYNDFMDKGCGFTVGTEIQFKRLSLSAEYEWLKCDSGHTTQRNLANVSDFTEADTTPGTESSMFSVLLTYRIK